MAWNQIMMKIIKPFLIVFCALFLLSGCVRYDVGVNFQDQTHGQIVQKIQLAERLTSFNRDVINEWVSTLERRVKQLKGRTQKLSKQEILVTLPFYNGKDLEDKFNHFFNFRNIKTVFVVLIHKLLIHLFTHRSEYPNLRNTITKLRAKRNKTDRIISLNKVTTFSFHSDENTSFICKMCQFIH